MSFKVSVLALLMLFVVWGSAGADDVSGMLGLGLHTGLMKMTGGDHDYSNVDEHFGAHLRYGFSPHWSLIGALKYGWNRPGAEPGEDAGFEFAATAPYHTVIIQPRLGLRFSLAPDERLTPFVEAAGNYTYWRIKDRTGLGDAGHFLPPDGVDLIGYATDGQSYELTDNHFGISLGAGLELFTTCPLFGLPLGLELGGRYHYIFSSELDNIGLSAIHGEEHVDANNAWLDGFVGFTLYFGSRDKDGDGIEDDVDECPDQAEDFDEFQDTDGCPDPDNDGDGLLDDQDQCPDNAEDLDGFEDADGCPDIDNDNDGVADRDDQCPNEAEDADGFEDADGCPDPDNDGDGVLDAHDQCPDTPAGVEVDETGCPVVEEIKAELILTGVHFANNSAELTPESRNVLDEVVESLRAYPNVTIEVQGHTDSRGSEEHNLDLSQRRAASVRDYFISQGIAPGRMTAMGYGEGRPIASNDTNEGRAQNRRVELHRTD